MLDIVLSSLATAFLTLKLFFEEMRIVIITAPFKIMTVAVTGYLIGSIPFGLIFTRLAGLGDIRTIGSGNTGATNVLRTGNRKLAALTLLCDMLKGLAAVLIMDPIIAAIIGHDSILYPPVVFIAGPLAGFFAFLGHIFPVWLGFKGGKGVATYLGVLLAIAWPCAVIFGLVWLATAFISRYSSLAALFSVMAVPVFAFFYLPPYSSIFITLMSIITVLKHHSNIQRLCTGTENKIGTKVKQIRPEHFAVK